MQFFLPKTHFMFDSSTDIFCHIVQKIQPLKQSNSLFGNNTARVKSSELSSKCRKYLAMVLGMYLGIELAYNTYFLMESPKFQAK